ncbi:MAG: cytochrome [Nevskia sp.]|nr:cytochrome [Nevskia sp.]
MRRRHFLQLGSLAALGSWPGFADAHGKARGRVVIAGGGFAGSSCALYLKRAAPKLEVVLVDPETPYTSCPLSSGVLAGLRDLASLQVSREGLQRAGVRYLRARVTTVDAQHHRVHLDSGATLAYERLVVAPGIRMRWGTPEGYDEAAAQRMPHAWIAGAQTTLLARQLQAMDVGGVVAISVPPAPYRCPPGPYERASLIAHFLKAHKPRGKVLIFDTNNHFPKQDRFNEAWQQFYPGLIEWIPVTEGGAVQRVEPEKMLLHTSSGAHTAAVANVIPPQAPGALALDTGLCSGHGWCPVKPESFESTLIADVHVIGDACIAGAMPKAASAAHSQGLRCALALAAILDGQAAPDSSLNSVCYNLLAPGYAISMHGRFGIADDAIAEIKDDPGEASGVPQDPVREAQAAEDWYREIVAQSFG